MGNKTQTASTSTSPNAAAMSAYQNILANTSNLSQTPYNPYTGQGVAPVNAQQTAGIGNVNAFAGAAQPAIGQAEGMVQAAASPLTAGQIQNYYDPYNQNVIAATQKQFNLQNQTALNNIKSGAEGANAVGGDRASSVAPAAYYGATLPGQEQAIAGLEQQGYQSALATAGQQYQQNPTAAAFALGNLGISGQGAGLAGANAQVGAGTLEQQTQQAQDVYGYQQYLNQNAYPFQLNQYAAGIDTGVGSQMGGQSQTQYPGPSLFGQFAGLGVAAAGAYGASQSSRDGGRVGYAEGGQIYVPPEDAGDEPQVSITRGPGPPAPPQIPSQSSSSSSGGIGLGDIAKLAPLLMAAYRGGRISGLATGGAPYGGGNGYLPGSSITSGKGAPAAPQIPSQQQSPVSKETIQGLSKLGGGSQQAATPGQAPTFSDQLSDFTQDLGDSQGGRVGMAYGGLALPSQNRIHVPIRSGLGMPSFMRGGFAEGGSPDDFNSRWEGNAGPSVDSTIQDYVAPQVAPMPDSAAPVAPQGSPPPGIAPPPTQVAEAPQNAPAGVSEALPPEITSGNSMGPMKRAIAANEGTGSYTQVGPATRDGDHAYGKYQVMGNNIGKWTAEALGKPMNVAEFLHSPEAQEAVFEHKFGQYVNKYGPEGASRAWFAGEGGMNNPKANDRHWTVGQYAQNFTKNLGLSGGEDGALAFNGEAPPRGGLQAPAGETPPPVDQPPPDHHNGLFGLSPDFWQSVMATGAGMMASHSQFPLTAAGEGLQHGLAQYGQLRNQNLREKAEKDTVESRANALAEAARWHTAEIGHQGAQEKLGREEFEWKKLQPVTIQTPYGTVSAKKLPDGTYQNIMTGEKLGADGVPDGQPTTTAPAPAKGQQTASLMDVQNDTHAEGTNPEVLARIAKQDPGLAKTVKAIAEGRQSLQSVGYKDKTMLAKLVNEYDDNWSQQIFAQRQRQLNDESTSGNAGKMLLAVNQLWPHLKVASDKAAELENTNYPAINSIKNWWLTATGDPRVQKFDTVREVASLDTARLLRGGGQMSEKDIEEWRKRLATSGSPRQLQGVLGELADDLMSARVGSIEQAHRTIIGKEPPQWISKEARNAMQQIIARRDATEAGQTTAQPTSQQPSASAPPTAIEHLKQNPSLRNDFDAKYGAGSAAKVLGQ